MVSSEIKDIESLILTLFECRSHCLYFTQIGFKSNSELWVTANNFIKSFHLFILIYIFKFIFKYINKDFHNNDVILWQVYNLIFNFIIIKNSNNGHRIESIQYYQLKKPFFRFVPELILLIV
jgi:hypothetical protein